MWFLCQSLDLEGSIILTLVRSSRNMAQCYKKESKTCTDFYNLIGHLKTYPCALHLVPNLNCSNCQLRSTKFQRAYSVMGTVISMICSNCTFLCSSTGTRTFSQGRFCTGLLQQHLGMDLRPKLGQKRR